MEEARGVTIGVAAMTFTTGPLIIKDLVAHSTHNTYAVLVIGTFNGGVTGPLWWPF